MLNVSPAQPPPDFRNALSIPLPDADPDAVDEVVRAAVDRVQRFAPGYRLSTCSVLPGDRIFISVTVSGRGDLLPEYAGNLDIINDAAVTVAELRARARLPQTPMQMAS